MLSLVVRKGAYAQTDTRLLILLLETYWGPHSWVFLKEHLQQKQG